MPFGKPSQVPVPKPHMVKTHAGVGNHKQILRSHAAVAANAGNFKAAKSNQPGASSTTSGKAKQC